jgi:hypothetical protein
MHPRQKAAANVKSALSGKEPNEICLIQSTDMKIRARPAAFRRARQKLHPSEKKDRINGLDDARFHHDASTAESDRFARNALITLLLIVRHPSGNGRCFA